LPGPGQVIRPARTTYQTGSGPSCHICADPPATAAAIVTAPMSSGGTSNAARSPRSVRSGSHNSSAGAGRMNAEARPNTRPSGTPRPIDAVTPTNSARPSGSRTSCSFHRPSARHSAAPVRKASAGPWNPVSGAVTTFAALPPRASHTAVSATSRQADRVSHNAATTRGTASTITPRTPTGNRSS
jgi:hypothetical protein